MVTLSEREDISYSLPLLKETIRARNGLLCNSLDKMLRDKICHVTCFTVYLLYDKSVSTIPARTIQETTRQSP